MNQQITELNRALNSDIVQLATGPDSYHPSSTSVFVNRKRKSLDEVRSSIMGEDGIKSEPEVVCDLVGGQRKTLTIYKILKDDRVKLYVCMDFDGETVTEETYDMEVSSLLEVISTFPEPQKTKIINAPVKSISWANRFAQKCRSHIEYVRLFLLCVPTLFSVTDVFDEVIDLESAAFFKKAAKEVDSENMSCNLPQKVKQRLRREEHQRRIAFEKSEAVRKSVPKETRKAKIAEARLNKYWEALSLTVDEQSAISEYESLTERISEQGLFGFVRDLAYMPYNISQSVRAFNETLEKVNAVITPGPDTTSIAGSVIGSVVDVANTANQRSRRIMESIDRVADNANTVTGKISQIIDDLKAFLSKDLPFLVMQVVLVVFLAFIFVKVQSPIVKMAVVAAVGTLFSREIYNLFSEFFQRGEQGEIEQESGFTNFVAQAAAMAFMSTVFAVDRPPTYISLLVKLVSGISNFPRLTKGMENVVEFIQNSIEFMVNTVRTYIGKHPVRIFHKFAAEVEQKIDEANKFCVESVSGRLREKGWSDPMVYNRFVTFINYFTDIRKETTSGDKLRVEIDKFIGKLMRLSEPYRVAMNTSGGFRPQPVTVVLGGAPGIGKTTITQSLCLTIMKLSGHLSDSTDVTEASRSIFMKPANSKYMDGYTNQFAFLIDDLFQIKPVPGVEGGQIEDIMTYHGPISAALNMADLPKKGMYPFASRMILCTTNAMDLESEVGFSSIALSKEAFMRRLDHHVIIQVKEEYRLPNSHKLDYRKFIEEEKKMPHNMHAYPWHIWEVMDTTFGGIREFLPGTGRCMIDFINEIVEHIKYNQESHETQAETFKKIMSADVSTWGERPIANESGFQKKSLSPDEILSYKLGPLPFILEDDEEFNLNNAEHTLESALLDMIVEETTKRQQQEVPSLTAEQIRNYMDIQSREATKGLKDIVRNLYTGFTWDRSLGILKTCAVATIAVTIIAGLFKFAYDSICYLIYGRPVDEESNGPKLRTAHCFKQEMVQVQNGSAEVPGLWYNVYKNTYKVMIQLPCGDCKVLGQLLVLEGTTFVMPYHFIRDIGKALDEDMASSDDHIILRSCALQRHEVQIRIKDFLGLKRYDLPERDLCFGNLGRVISRRKSIVHFLLNSSSFPDQGGKTARLDTARVTSAGQLLEFSERVTFFSPSIEPSNGRTKYIGAYPTGTEHKHWIRYNADTNPGDCGAILSLTDHSSTACRFVLGLHVGRRSGSTEAYATQLDQEVAKLGLSKVGVEPNIDTPLDAVADIAYQGLNIMVEPTSELPFSGDDDTFGSFLPVAVVSKGVHSPVDTNKVKTFLGKEEYFSEQIKDLSGSDEVAKLQVMKLRPYSENGQVVFPMVRALEPFAGNTLFVNEDKFSFAVQVAMKKFSDATVDYCARVLTPEEAICGVPALELASIPRSTSLGFPWCTQARDKSYFFGKADYYDLTTPEAKGLINEIKLLEGEVLKGVRPFFVCRDFLKDEVRKAGKNARLIAGTDVRYYILCRMYFGAFVAALMRTHQQSGACIGVNQYAEWGWLREFITNRGDKVWDGDFAGFDSSQQPQMLWCLLDYINEWYRLRGDDNSSARKILFMDLVHSRHLVAAHGPATHVVEWCKSLPSGHFLTTTVNTMLSMSCIVGSYIGTTGRIDFWDNAAVAAQGDDNLVNASDNVIAEFNQVTCANFLKREYGMVYTAGRKGEELKPFMGIGDVVFLQRTFQIKEGVVVCPIRPESFLFSLYYTQKNKEKKVQKEDMIVGLERALEELALHPEEKWAFTSGRIVEALKSLGTTPALSTRDSRQYLQAVLSRVPSYI